MRSVVVQLTVPQEWNTSFEGHNGVVWGLILLAPNLLNLILVICVDDSANADREVCLQFPSPVRVMEWPQ